MLFQCQDIRSAQSYKQNVLILDDQFTCLTIMRAVVKKVNPNVNVISLTSPFEALEWLEKRRADLIITDYLMKNMNGVEFVNAARLTKHGDNVPIVVVTASKSYKVHGQLLSAGVVRTFVKPASPFDLGDTCKEILSKNIQKYQLANPSFS